MQGHIIYAPTNAYTTSIISRVNQQIQNLRISSLRVLKTTFSLFKANKTYENVGYYKSVIQTYLSLTKITDQLLGMDEELISLQV